MIPPEAPAAPSGSTLARSFGAGTALDLFPGAISMTIDENRAREVEKLIAFQEEAARHFEKRPTGGEDAAYWSNTYNAENCRKTVAALRALAASPTPPAPLRADADLRAAAVDAVIRVRWGDDAQKIRDYGGFYLERAEEIADAVLALTARQDAASDAGVDVKVRDDLGPIPEARVSLIARAVRQSLRSYGHKGAESILPECIAADVEASLQTMRTTPEPEAPQGEALATQENNHAG